MSPADDDNRRSRLGTALIVAVASALAVAVGGAFAGYVANKSAARSTAVDQATGAARAYVVIFDEMQGGLDAMLEWHQKIYPPVSGQAWNIGVDDLKSLGVVLGPEGLWVVERASQELDSVFPPSFHGEPVWSMAAEQQFSKWHRDLRQADELVRCAEIYLSKVKGIGTNIWPHISGRSEVKELDGCARTFPTSPPA